MNLFIYCALVYCEKRNKNVININIVVVTFFYQIWVLTDPSEPKPF